MNTHLTHDRRTKVTFAGVFAMLAVSLALIVSGWGGSNVPEAQAHTHAVAPKAKTAKKKAKVNQAKVRSLYLGMRTLWDQHMQWTYAVVTSFVNGSPNLNAEIDRLLQNQKDIGNAIKPVYGKKAGNQLTSLLTEHIQLAVPVLTAAKAGDDAALGTAVADWYRNADDIGKFLAGANPAWKGSRNMLKAHITGTIAYAVDQLQGDYAKSIQDYDAAQKHMAMLGDQLAAGIVKAFPKAFR